MHRLLFCSSAILSTASALKLARVPRRHATARCSEQPSADYGFAQQLRSSKAALARGLEAEGGVLSQDALALVEGLERVNPSAPDPTNDPEFYTGAFRVLTVLSPPLLRAHELTQAAASVEVGGACCTLAVELAHASGEVALIAAEAELSAVDDVSFALALDTACVTPGGGAEGGVAAAALVRELLPSAPAVAATDGEALALGGGALAQLTATVLYMDQDFIVAQVVRSDDPAEERGVDDCATTGCGIVVLARDA